MVQYFLSHPVEWLILAFLASYAVRALPEPKNAPVGFWQGLYFWFHNFTHLILANPDKLKLPAMLPPK